MLRGQSVVFIIGSFERVHEIIQNAHYSEVTSFFTPTLNLEVESVVCCTQPLFSLGVLSSFLFKLFCVCECRFIFIKILEITFQSLVYVSFPGFYLLDSFPRVPFCLSSKVKKYSLYLESGRWGYSLIPSWEIHFYYWPIPWGVASGSAASLCNHWVILTLDDECQSGAGQGSGQAPREAAPVMHWESGCSFITQTWTCGNLKENNTHRGHMTLLSVQNVIMQPEKHFLFCIYVFLGTLVAFS